MSHLTLPSSEPITQQESDHWLNQSPRVITDEQIDHWENRGLLLRKEREANFWLNVRDSALRFFQGPEAYNYKAGQIKCSEDGSLWLPLIPLTNQDYHNNRTEHDPNTVRPNPTSPENSRKPPEVLTVNNPATYEPQNSNGPEGAPEKGRGLTASNEEFDQNHSNTLRIKEASLKDRISEMLNGDTSWVYLTCFVTTAAVILGVLMYYVIRFL